MTYQEAPDIPKASLPAVSFIIPTLNNEKDLEPVLFSIRAQNYPKNKVEILVSDGGSNDKTRQIAENFGCKVLDNKKVLAEYGIALGMKFATGEIHIVVASDNFLVGDSWLLHMVRPFMERKTVQVVSPTQISTANDHWVTKYWLMFSDPFNHFVYWNACNARTYAKVLPITSRGPGYEAYKFDYGNHPILALAQGVATRSIIRTETNSGDDILPVIEQIAENGMEIAWVPDAKIEHHTISRLASFVRKQRWAIKNALEGERYGVNARKKYFSKWRKLRVYFWPFYGLSFIFPLAVSIVMLVLEKKIEWIYHAPISFISAATFWQEFIKIKVLRISKKYYRY